jgi:hypothetical protein
VFRNRFRLFQNLVLWERLTGGALNRFASIGPLAAFALCASLFHFSPEFRLH